MTPEQAMQAIDRQLSHVWMVREFVKHSDEVEDDDELAEIHRRLYDCMLAVGPAWTAQDGPAYVKLVKKKISKLRRTAEDFAALQPEVSTHTNFQMAVRSLAAAVQSIDDLLGQAEAG